MKKKPLLVASLLGLKASKATTLIAKAKHLSQINILVNQSLDHQISEHTYVATLHNGQLTLVVDSPVWATRLRYMQQTIINDLKKYSITRSVVQIKIKVRPLEHRLPRKAMPKKPKIILSHSSAERMQKELEAISDPMLKSSLQKILRHAKNGS